jgi:hypothetical protein
MDEKVEAQELLDGTVRKIESTKRALGNGEVEAHARINHMMRYIKDYLGDDVQFQPQARCCSPALQTHLRVCAVHLCMQPPLLWCRWAWSRRACATQMSCRSCMRR